MLSLLSLASAKMCWQLGVDMRMAALLEVGCLSHGCLFQSLSDIRQVLAMEMDEMFFRSTVRVLDSGTLVSSMT